MRRAHKGEMMLNSEEEAAEFYPRYNTKTF